MIYSIHAEKAFDKIHHAFMIKVLKRLEIKEDIPQHHKGYIDKPSNNITLDREKSNQSKLVDCLLSMIFFSIMLEVIAREKR